MATLPVSLGEEGSSDNGMFCQTKAFTRLRSVLSTKAFIPATLSCISTSTSWPLPVRARCTRAADGDREVHAGPAVADVGAVEQRPVGLAGHAHCAGGRLGHWLEALVVTVRAV